MAGVDPAGSACRLPRHRVSGIGATGCYYPTLPERYRASSRAPAPTATDGGVATGYFATIASTARASCLAYLFGLSDTRVSPPPRQRSYPLRGSTTSITTVASVYSSISQQYPHQRE